MWENWVDFRNFLLFLNRFQNEVHFTANCFSDGGSPFSRYVYVAINVQRVNKNHSSLSIWSLLNRYVVVYGIGFGFVTSGSFGKKKKVEQQDKDEDITDIITSEGEEGWLEKVLKKVNQFNLHF